MISNEVKVLAATLRGSRPRVQSASLYDNFGKLPHYDVIDDVITRKLQELKKNGDHLPTKSSELSNGENRIALRQLLQNRKLRHL